MPLNNPITSALLADPEIFQQNRLPFHAHFADQTSPELPLTVSLDGEWNFRYAENLTAPFTDWDTLTVPGFIQMQSLQKPGQPYGTPHYVNTQYPWDGHEKLHPGQIPQDYNPIGEYQRSFTLPESWASCYLRLNGADSAAAVWCNGVYIGYTEDTFTPAEFDMTAAVHPGENTLTVQVYRFSSGSWLEDQDFWRMSGLFRSVELFTKPEIHLEDVFVKQDFAPDFSSATVTFDCKVSGAGTVSVVFDGEEQSAEVGEPAEYDSGMVFGKGEADPDVEEDVQDVSFTFTVEHPALWSAEQPNLYETEIALLREGALVERTGLKVGLRKFELKDRQMLLNGQRIVFKGVNRHEWSCRTDPSRLVHYEGIFWNREYPATSDMESQMYTPVADIKKFLAEHPEKPFIMCEYSHAMGNSCGGITDYTEYAYEEPLYQGGFIWEYMDHGIAVTGPDGKPGFAYGGDFGDRPTDREFCVDGLVLPDRRNTPKMDAVKAAYAPLKITLTDTEVVIENRNLFTDLSAYDLVFASSVNGKPERRAVLRADCAPGKTAHIAFPFPLPETGLACMTVTAVQRAAKPGIPTGYEAAFGQVWHNYAAARLTVAAPELVEMDCNIGVKGDGFEYIFGRGKGLVSIRYNGVQLLDDTVRPNFWRAPTNNDEGCAEPFAFAFWKTAGLYARCDNLTAEAKDEFVIVRANYTLPDGQTLPIDFAIDGAGRCDITMTWQGEKTELPEFGLLFPMRRELTKVSYLGLGPRETTADRTAGGKMGAWSYNVRQDFAQNSPVYPQECGSRTGVYSAALTGSGLNIGIGFAGDGMTFSALPYTPHELENARHLYELPRDDNKTVVRCAAFQRGVGGDNSWGAKPHADACFAVEKGTSFRFTIQK